MLSIPPIHLLPSLDIKLLRQWRKSRKCNHLKNSWLFKPAVLRQHFYFQTREHIRDENSIQHLTDLLLALFHVDTADTFLAGTTNIHNSLFAYYRSAVKTKRGSDSKNGFGLLLFTSLHNSLL